MRERLVNRKYKKLIKERKKERKKLLKESIKQVEHIEKEIFERQMKGYN